MDLLRSHETDPAGLGWLGRTSATGAYLGLWSSTHRERIEIAGRFARPAPGPGEAEPMDVAAFPPADLIARAGTCRDGMVSIVPVKVLGSDWGLLAVADSVETRVTSGREPVNQWGALLAVALDHRAVLRALRTQEDRLRTAALY